MNLISTAVLCFFAATSISFVEAIARTTSTMPMAMLKAAPFVVVAQVSLYYIFSGAHSVMAAWIIFTIFMSLTRVVNSVFFLQEGLDVAWVGLSIGLMVGAVFAMKQAHIGS